MMLSGGESARFWVGGTAARSQPRHTYLPSATAVTISQTMAVCTGCLHVSQSCQDEFPTSSPHPAQCRAGLVGGTAARSQPRHTYLPSATAVTISQTMAVCTGCLHVSQSCQDDCPTPSPHPAQCRAMRPGHCSTSPNRAAFGGRETGASFFSFAEQTLFGQR